MTTPDGKIAVTRKGSAGRAKPPPARPVGATVCLGCRRLGQLLLDDWPHRIPGQRAAADHQRSADNELNQQDNQIMLLTTHFSAGIGGTAAGTGFGRGIHLVAASAASYERHPVFPLRFTFGSPDYRAELH